MANIGIMILQAIYVFLPAAVANMAPVLGKKWFKWMAKPIDFGAKLRGKRVFGAHKTFRGFVLGFIFALIIAYIQQQLYIDYPGFRDFSVINYSAMSVWLIAFLMSFGALIGDAVESFFKRQKGVEPGKPFVPWDQIDFVLGFLVLTLWTLPWTANQYWIALILVILIPFLHVLFTFIGWKLKLKKSWI